MPVRDLSNRTRARALGATGWAVVRPSTGGCRGGRFSPALVRPSLLIAKIPLPLARYIASVFRGM